VLMNTIQHTSNLIIYHLSVL